MYQCVFFSTSARFSPAPVGLSRALGCGARRRPACKTRRKFGSRAGSVARALGVQNRKTWQVTMGSLSTELMPSKAMENPHISCFAPLCQDCSNTATNDRFKLSSALQLRTLLCVCRPLLCRVLSLGTRCMCCVCVCTGLSMYDAC